MEFRFLVAVLVFLSFLSLAPAVLATEFNAVPQSMELRISNDWASSITARDTDLVSARMVVQLDSDDGDGSDVSIVESYAKVWGRKSGGNWEQVSILPSNSLSMHVGQEKTFYWNDAFRVSSGYEEYRFEGFARGFGENFDESAEAFISDVREGSACNDIQVISRDITVDEGTAANAEFEIRNDSDGVFFVDSTEFQESNGFFSIEKGGFDNQIESHSSGTLRLRINAGSVSETETGNATVRITGHFEDRSCPSGTVNDESFSVSIRETAGGSTRSCQDIQMTTFPVFLAGNATVLKTVPVLNLNDRRFFVEGAEAVSSSSLFTASIAANDSSINAHSEGRVTVRIAANSSSGNQTGSVTVRLRGRFENDLACGFGDVPEKVISVTLEQGQEASCSLLNGEVSDIQLGENDEKEFTFRLQNNSNSNFTILEVVPEENEPDFGLTTVSVPASAPAFGAAEIRLKAKTIGSFGEQTLFGSLRMRGKFASGLECGFNDFSTPIRFLVSSDNTITDGDEDTTGVCSELDVQTHTVELDAGNTITEDFVLRNRSDRTFFIESVDAYDNSSDVRVLPDTFDTEVPAGEDATVSVQVEAEDSSSNRSATGYVKVRGHFSNQQNCSFSSVGTETFSIRVNGSNSGSDSGNANDNGTACTDMRLSVPAGLVANPEARVSFLAENPTSETALVYLRGANLTVSPATFSIPSHSQQTYSSRVQYRGTTYTELEFSMVGESCRGESQFTTVSASSGGFEPQPPIGPQQQVNGSGIQIVQAPSQLVFAKRATVVATVQNNTNSFQTIQTYLVGLSPNWFSDKISLGFQPGETKTVFLDVSSNNQYGSFNGALVAEAGCGRTEKPIQLTSVEMLGLGSDFAVKAGAAKKNDTTIAITATIESHFGQQMQGTASLETVDGAILQQKSFIVNPGGTQAVSFDLVRQNGQDLPSAVNVRIVLEDGRSTVQRVELQQGILGGIFSTNIGSFFLLLGADSLTIGLLAILIILLLVAIWQSQRKPYRAYAKIVGPVQRSAPKAAAATTETMTKTVETTTSESTVETPAPSAAPNPAGNGNANRFWFLRE